ncbi:MAG: response regulator [Anaerolineae bacterium]|nr:response regulator [Anaerolineae bacterium]
MSTVLLIEDDPQCARLTQKILMAQGHTVLVASNGMVGLRMAREIKADIVLLDLTLPGLPGTSVIVQLRGTAKFGNVPIIAYTADASEKTKRLVASLGCDGIITKPVDFYAFPKQVQQFIDKGSRQDQHLAASAS